MRILLTEENCLQSEAILLPLAEAGYVIECIKNPTAVRLADSLFDIVVLSAGLSTGERDSLKDLLRATGRELPLLIMMTCSQLADQRSGWADADIDGYIATPFDAESLLACLRNARRRREGQGAPLISNGEIVLDPASYQAVDLLNGKIHRLSIREFTLMQALMSQPGRPLSRRELESKLYGWGEGIESNAVEFFIHSLRKKMGSGAIKNIRGVGWMISS
ncbi:winged helix-turn-helix domain-containing protein [Erwinia tasmaniensis]|uniref:winged helix-turn-helix domain-containing protein n=1 Tax=Erwinia tasmaniensis TaxID=338565 RepID=UPI003A4D2EFE